MPKSLVSPLMAALGVAAMSWLGLYGYAWNDYETEAQPAMQALVHGHFTQFAQLAPSYGGSLLLRAPFALLPGLWGGGSLAVYQAISVPCLVAGALLGLWLCARLRAERASMLTRALTLALCVANPLMLRALELGHAEELLLIAMCLGALLLVERMPSPTSTRWTPQPRALGAGVLVGLAVANKEWALIAVGPVLLLLKGGRWQMLGAASAAAAALLAPIAAFSSSFVSATRGVASTPSAIFQPWQVFWFFGRHGALVHGAFGNPKYGYRIAPGWVGPISHPLIIACGLLLPAALWWQRRRSVRKAARSHQARAIGLPACSLSDALLLLTLLLALRCLLDTWDNVYYTVPLLICLLTWEVCAFKRPPVAALGATVLCWAGFQWLPQVASADLQAAFFLAWTVPLTAALALRLYAPSLRLRIPIPAGEPSAATLAGESRIATPTGEPGAGTSLASPARAMRRSAPSAAS